MISITREAIIHEALKHLRQYYKFRDRSSDLRTARHLQSADGLIADGQLRFQDADGQDFIANLEATDYLERDELRYRVQYKLLLLEAILIAMTLAVGVFGWLHLTDRIDFYGPGPLQSIGLLVLAILALAGGLVFLLMPLDRYHYIYAIEQFKQYKANDKWIAFSHDVFSGKEDKYFRKLRKQCIYNGLGLLEIERNLDIHVHMNPPESLVGEEPTQGIRRWVAQQPVSRRLSSSEQYLPRFMRQRGIRPPAKDLVRFKRPLHYQFVIASVNLLLLLIFVVREVRDRSVNYVNEVQYEMARLQDARRMRQEAAEEMYFIPALPDSIEIIEKNDTVRPYLDVAINRRGLNPTPDVAPEATLWLFDRGRIVPRSCTSLGEEGEDYFVIFIKATPGLELAKQQVLYLRQRDVQASIIWADCLMPGKRNYLLIDSRLYQSFEDARIQINRIKLRLPEGGTDYSLNVLRLLR